MALFDKMFGSGAEAAEKQPDTQKRFEELKSKYASVLNAIQQNPQISLRNVHVQDNKLFIKGTVPSADVKNQIWNQIKLVNPQFDDLTADLTVEESASNNVASGGQTYTVQPGDTLSKISKQFYGDANDYMNIFNANKDKLTDPNKIQVGQVLTIPPQ